MTRLKALLIAAATLVGGGALLTVALQQSAENLSPPMSCKEWAHQVFRWSDPDRAFVYFVAAQTGVNPPAAFGNRVLGDCSAGQCTVSRQDCSVSYSYNYEIILNVDGWRLGRITAIPYIAGGHKAWADATPGAKWLGSFGEVVGNCLEIRSAAECDSFLAPTSDCWLLSNGNLCRYEKEYGPGLGGTQACSAAPSGGDTPIDCADRHGAGSAVSDSNLVWRDSELGL